MRACLILVLGLGLLAGGHAPAHAWTYGDTLTVIWKPLPNLPTILRPGDILTVWANAPSSAGSWTAALKLGATSFALSPAGGAWQPSLGWWMLDFTIPAGLPEELYDLTLGCGTCPPSAARHSVKVLPAFKTDFYFAQVTDTHVPSHVFSSDEGFSTSDTTGMADFGAVIDDLNLIRPEFVLHTGDLVNEGELEDHLGMHEMGRAQAMLYRFRDPAYLVPGNHDIGGWQATPPPAGTARGNWWRYFGWPALASPPVGYRDHSQDYSFDYGLLHCIGMEAYQNSGNYDGYLPDIYGANSMNPEQMDWLVENLAAVPPGHSKLAFFHYDFSGQFTNLAALGLDGAIWGHVHSLPDRYPAARPFSLGLRSVSYSGYGSGGRAFRIFRVHNGAITPGPMHHSGGTAGTPTDSLTVTWSAPNDGSRSGLRATITNRFGERWDHARLVFHLASHVTPDTAAGGTVAQVVQQGDRTDVYVDCVVPASGVLTVAVPPTAPEGEPAAVLRLEPPRPNPFPLTGGNLVLRYVLPAADHVRIRVYDMGGRLVATVFDGWADAGENERVWNGRSNTGELVGTGLYLVQIRSAAGEKQARVTVLR
jgi:hypothetical protein